MKKIGLLKLLFFFTIIFSSNVSIFSANRFWVGTGAGSWNNAANWSAGSGGASGASIPGPADIVIFDGGGINNCSLDINTSVSGFTISSAYTGTIIATSGITITVGASGFSQSGGTFIGSTGNISVNGSYNLSGGIFTSTSSTLQISSGYNFTGGTFNHNNGTVSFSTTQTITGNTSFYNILFVASGGVYTINGGTTISSANNVSINGGFSCTINGGTVEILGDLTLASSSNNSVNGGTATFLFDGSGNQSINSSIATILVGTNERICNLPNVEINKTSGTLFLNGVVNLNGSTWKTTAGASLINAGTSTLNINSSVTFSGQNLSLTNIHIYANSQAITLSPATYVLTCTNSLTINGGSYYQVNNGVLEIQGDLNLINTSNSAINGGSGKFLFDGTGTQNIITVTSSPNNVCAIPSVEINKISGQLNLIGTINFSGTSWNTIAGASLINPGTSKVNILKTTTLSGQNLNLYDIIITGNSSTITINPGLTWTSTHLLTLGGGANWYQINGGTLNAQGDVIVTNTNTSNNVGGNAVLLFDGNTNQTLTGSGIAGGGRLPQVQINKTGGTLTFANPIISADNNWTYISGAVDATTNFSTIDFYKTSVIDGQGISNTMSFNHVIFSGFISLGGNMDVNGDFNIRSGVNNRLDVNAVNNFQLNIGGNWTNNNSVTTTSFNQQNGKVVFDGNANQSINLALASHTETFYNVEINNTAGDLTLNAPVTISNNINFINGKVISSISNILLLNNAVTATGASNNSFVSGPVCKTGNQAFTFPVGKNNVYAPISISAPAVNTNQFTAEYFQTDPNPLYNVALKDVTIDHISRCEYWNLDRTSGTSNVIVGLSWDNRSCLITNLTDLRVARWNGSLWKDHGNGGTTGNTSQGTINTALPVTSFGQFTLASASIENPLPIELTSFTASCENDQPALHWNTASETNNDYFLIERSDNGLEWDILDTIKGAGNSSVNIEYSFLDGHEAGTSSYYRIQQTDFDGNHHYSETAYLESCGAEFVQPIINVFPNPTTGRITVKYSNPSSIYPTMILDSKGQILIEQKMLGVETEIDLSGLSPGMYFVRTEKNVQKIIKQ